MLFCDKVKYGILSFQKGGHIFPLEYVRNMNTRKIISFVTAMTLALSASGCSDKTPPPEETTATSASSETTVPTESSAETEPSATETERVVPPMDTSPLTLTVFVDDMEYAAISDTPVMAEITKRTGVTLEFILPEDESTLDSMLESGELPDLIYAGERTTELIESGALIPLDDYNASVGEYFSELYGDNLDTLRADDGKLYTFGTGGSTPAQFTAEGTFQIQYAVLAELGYPEITTLEQLDSVLREYKELYPASKGLLLCGAPTQQWLDTVGDRVSFLLGCPDDGDFIVDNETGEVSYKWTDPRTGEIMKIFNQMYNDGIISDKSFSLKHNPYLELIGKGNVAAIADYREDYGSAEETLANAGLYDKMYCPLAVTLDGNDSVQFLADYGDFDVSDGIGITTACSEPERAFRFLDWWCSDEAQDLVNFGSDEINAEFDPSSESYTEDTGAGYYTEPFPMRGLTEKNADGEYYSIAVSKYAAEFTKPQKAAADAYGVTLFSEMFPQRNELPVYRRTLISEMEIHTLSEEAILLDGLSTYIKTEVQAAIKLPPEEFDAKWQEITDWCHANGADRVSEIMTSYVKADMGLA